MSVSRIGVAAGAQHVRQSVFVGTVEIVNLPPVVVTCPSMSMSKRPATGNFPKTKKKITGRFDEDDAPAECPAPADETEEDGESLEDANGQVDDEGQQPVLSRHPGGESRSPQTDAQQPAENRPYQTGQYIND